MCEEEKKRSYALIEAGRAIGRYPLTFQYLHREIFEEIAEKYGKETAEWARKKVEKYCRNIGLSLFTREEV